MEGPEFNGTHSFDRVLVSIGRRPVTSGIGLENTKVKVNDKGFVVVNEQQQTADPHILAIGDVAGEPMLAHKASHEGKVAAEVLAGEPAAFEPQAIPAVVFTDPEIAWAGLTVDEAKRAGRDVAVAQYPWQASGRAIANRPHRRAHQVDHRSGDRPRAGLRHRRRRRGRADRRSGRGDRNGLHGPRRRRLDPPASDAQRNASLRRRSLPRHRDGSVSTETKTDMHRTQ